MFLKSPKRIPHKSLLLCNCHKCFVNDLSFQSFDKDPAKVRPMNKLVNYTDYIFDMEFINVIRT